MSSKNAVIEKDGQLVIKSLDDFYLTDDGFLFVKGKGAYRYALRESDGMLMLKPKKRRFGTKKSL